MMMMSGCGVWGKINGYHHVLFFLCEREILTRWDGELTSRSREKKRKIFCRESHATLFYKLLVWGWKKSSSRMSEKISFNVIMLCCMYTEFIFLFWCSDSITYHFFSSSRHYSCYYSRPLLKIKNFIKRWFTYICYGCRESQSDMRIHLHS